MFAVRKQYVDLLLKNISTLDAVLHHIYFKVILLYYKKKIMLPAKKMKIFRLLRLVLYIYI